MIIPPRTLEMILAEHPEGTRHTAKIGIALPLIGDGMPTSDVLALLHDKFPQATEKENRGVVSWCQGKNPAPSAIRPTNGYRPKEIKLTPKETVAHLLGSQRNEIPTSPMTIPLNAHAETLLKALYSSNEHVNMVCKFTTSESKGRTKANPSGSGATKTRDEWIDYIAKNGTPESEAGAWMRPNPVLVKGSGADGAVTNADVTDFRFLLLESDELTIGEQLAVYKRLDLPLSAILTSGGTSCHAWLRMDSPDSDDYAKKAERILVALSGLGFDQANKNPSRLSRLPGVVRKIGASGDGKQELLFLDASAIGISDEEIRKLEIRVKPDRFLCVSMKDAVESALALYEDIHQNKHKAGLKTGFGIFDSLTGGLKKSWFTVVAGETGAGKTTYVLNIVMNALERDDGVALFSFEMDQQEILDMIFSRQATINRNKFNNGYFAQSDFNKMTAKCGVVANYPLFTFDDPTMNIRDVFEAAERRKIEGNLKLIVIDYLQLANVEDARDNREQQVAMISRSAKSMAKRLGVPVIGVSQLNETGKVRESRSIAHDANCVIVVSENGDEIEAKVTKGRSIPKGTYYYRFERDLCKIVELRADDRLMNFVPKEAQNNREISACLSHVSS